MNIVGMEADEQDAIFRVVAMILHLSNVRFSQDDDNKSKVDNMEVLKKAADLIRVDADKLAHALTTKTIIIMKKPITSNLDKAAASDARDALGKAIYDYMFNWIVWKINQRVCAQSYERFIGLLDIFGFEKFKVNSFEQLCINFANESLQGHYNSYTFKRDMIECADEGIDTKSVKFTDNQECIDLIQGRLGILAMLDEQTNFPKATDKTFLGKLKSSFGKGNNYFSSNPTTQEEFIITHYAGKVEYNVANWLEKNRDQLKPDLVELLITSPDKFISGIVPQNAREQLEATKGDASPAKGGSKVTTLGGSFKKQLLDLMTIINSTTPSWIRCVKPHPAKKPNMFSNPSTINQLRSSGVLETVRLRREGYSVRIPLEEFWKKYRSIIAEGVTNDVTDSCKRILAEVKFTPFMAQVGKTKVFLRSEPYKQLDIERNKRLMSKIQLIQRVGRGYLARKRVRKIREEIRLQKEREEYEKNRELYERLAREREERERVERERREAEERERAYLEELMRQEQERIAKEREERERIERERREAEEQERTKLQELKRKQLLRMDELQKLEREKEDRIRAEQKRIRDEEERILREQAEEEARLLEERRQEMLENERKRVELEKKQRLEARRQKHQERQDEKQRVEEERAARKEKADRQLREEATMKKQRTNEFIELAEIAREKLREEKEAWGRAEWERIQRQIYEEEMAKEAKIEFEREKLRRIEEAQKEFKRRLLEKTQKTYTKVTKAQIRQARLQQQRDEYIIKDMERKEAKKRENERRRHEEEIILMEKQAQMQWEIDKAKRREEMKHTIIKKIREEKIREAWKDKEEVRKEMQTRLQGEKELFELEMKLKQDQESLERKVAEDQLKKKSMYHQELEQAKKDQMEYDYQLELIKRKIGSVFIESPTAGNLSPRNMAGPPQPSSLQKSAMLSPRSQANHVSNASPSILRTSSARSNRSIPGMGSFSTPKKGSFSSLYPNRR
jgi:myosin heavy subunit